MQHIVLSAIDYLPLEIYSILIPSYLSFRDKLQFFSTCNSLLPYLKSSRKFVMRPHIIRKFVSNADFRNRILKAVAYPRKQLYAICN